MFGSKIKCKILKKKVAKKTAQNCQYFMPNAAPAGVSGADHAKKITSVKYKPNCDDCTNNEKFKMF